MVSLQDIPDVEELAFSKVSTKGAVIIPSKLRHQHNIHPGLKVYWHDIGNGEFIIGRMTDLLGSNGNNGEGRPDSPEEETDAAQC